MEKTANDHKRILIVDDEDQVIFVLRNGLKKLGDAYEVLVAHSGQEALERLREAPVDLLITDLKMPGVDGIALTEVAYAIVPGAKVIWITAYDRWEPDARRLGVYRYLLKPLDLVEIRQAVFDALEVAADQADKTRPASRKHILVVDDEPQEALALCGALEQSGGRYYVKLTLVAEEALSSLKSEQFDLVIAGLHAAAQDNLDLIRQVRRLTPKTRTLLMAEIPSPQLEEQCRQLAAACLAGPVDLDRFAASVQHILG